MNYKETSVTGSSYQRCNRVQIVNNLDRGTPTVIFGEELIVNVGSDVLHQSVNSECSAVFDPLAGAIPLLDLQTGEPTGAVATHMDLYQILYSLYIQTALARDAASIA